MIHEYLENGVEVVLKENHFAQAVAIQCWVGAGALHEGASERGMAHFIEHMLFKGTQRRAVGEIAATVEACGGEINAYTTFDHTVFYLTMASAHAAIGVDLLADAVFNSCFDPLEFDSEKEVILEEIRRGNDSPGSRLGRRVFEICYANTEAGRPIIGSEESVRSFKRDDLFKFYRKWYHPANLSLVVVGDMDEAAMLALVREKFGIVQPSSMPPQQPKIVTSYPRPEKTARLYEPMVSIIKGDYQQPRLEVVFPAPQLEHPDTPALDLAAFALGSGEMSRFNRRLRDQLGVVNSVGASVYSPRFGGIFEISALMSETQMAEAVEGLAREAMLLREHDPITADELGRARANLKSDRLYRDETVEGQARSLGFGLRTTYKLLHDEVYASLINSSSEALVTSALKKWLDPHRAVIVALVPEESKVAEASLKEAFVRGVTAGLSADLRAKTLARNRAQSTKAEAEVFQLSEGLKLVYRQNPEAALFAMTAATEGGLRAETSATAGIYNAFSSLLATASQNTDFERLVSLVEGNGASLEGFSGKDSFGFHLQCLTEQLDTMLTLFQECLLEPAFPEEQWVSLQREIEQGLAAQNDSPASIGLRRFQEAMFGNHPYRYPLLGTRETVASYTPESLLAAYKHELERGPWVIAAVGSLPSSQVVDAFRSKLSAFQPSRKPRRFVSDGLVEVPVSGSYRFTKDREQTHIVYGFRGITWGDTDRAALDVLTNILGGHGGRLFLNLRDRHGLAYTVSPIVSYGKHPGVVGSYIACAPSKAGQALDQLRAEMARLKDEPPTKAELDRARNYIMGNHEMGLQRSDAQTSTMALMEAYGYGYDDFLSYPKTIAKVSADEVTRVAQRLFDDNLAIDVVVGPE